jgi:hypothetical protein
VTMLIGKEEEEEERKERSKSRGLLLVAGS